jgi:hypothetical protein
MIPPRNGGFERQGVQMVWFLGNAKEPAWPQKVSMHYRVDDQRYVTPLSSPWRLQHALSAMHVQELRDAISPGLDDFSLYSDIALGMFSDAAFGGLTEEAFSAKWGRLAGGHRLLAVSGSADSRLANQYDGNRVSTWLTRPKEGSAELAENRLLWLCAALARGYISADEWIATLMCRWFRETITADEVEQFLAASPALEDLPKYHSFTISASRSWVERVVSFLMAEPYTPYTHPELFAKTETEPPTVPVDWLVLQQYAGTYKSGIIIRRQD